ncbi:nitrilase-related carbon-nitrogen hydrolase [Streptomyces sp. M19]
MVPEITRHLAWQGADLVLNLVRTPTVDRAQEVVLARANAIVNQVFMASLNAAAPDGVGRSVVVDPEGARAPRPGPVRRRF